MKDLITVADMRVLAVALQQLHLTPKKAITKYDIYRIISLIGLIQLDSISFLQRSHFIVLFSRLGNYEHELVNHLQYPDTKIIEKWLHVASIIPTNDLTHIFPLILRRRLEPIPKKILKIYGKDAEKQIKNIYITIKNKGILSASDFEETNPNKKLWWSKKPARLILDYLFRRGFIDIVYRKIFICHYSINNIPKSKISSKEEDQSYIWIILRTINILGIASMDEIIDYYRLEKIKVLEGISTLIKSKRIIEVNIQELNEIHFTTRKALNLLEKIRSKKIKINHTTVLSPFDNLIWHRKRTYKLFNVLFKSEMYTPIDKRKFGYYVLPILHNAEIVARVEFNKDKNNKTLIAKSIYFENHNSNYAQEDFESISKALIAFSIFLKLNRVIIDKVYPSKYKKQLNAYLK